MSMCVCGCGQRSLERVWCGISLIIYYLLWRGKGGGVGGFAFTYYPGQARRLVVNWDRGVGGGGGALFIKLGTINIHNTT